jgi:hypothetical protein
MTEKEALCVALKVAYRRWTATAQQHDYKSGPMPWAVLSPREMAVVRKAWPNIRGTLGNSILPSVLAKAVKTLEQETGTLPGDDIGPGPEPEDDDQE